MVLFYNTIWRDKLVHLWLQFVWSSLIFKTVSNNFRGESKNISRRMYDKFPRLFDKKFNEIINECPYTLNLLYFVHGFTNDSNIITFYHIIKLLFIFGKNIRKTTIFVFAKFLVT